MDLEPGTLLGLLCARAESQPEKTAYTFLIDGESEEDSLTYRELDQQARAIATLLQSRKAGRQPVLLLYPPGLEYIAAFFGCLYAGAVAVPVYPPTSQRSLPRLWSIVKDACPHVALTTSHTASKLMQALPSRELQTLEWLTTDNLDSELASQWQADEIAAESLAF